MQQSLYEIRNGVIVWFRVALVTDRKLRTPDSRGQMSGNQVRKAGALTIS